MIWFSFFHRRSQHSLTAMDVLRELTSLDKSNKQLREQLRYGCQLDTKPRPHTLSTHAPPFPISPCFQNKATSYKKAKKLRTIIPMHPLNPHGLIAGPSSMPWRRRRSRPWRALIHSSIAWKRRKGAIWRGLFLTRTSFTISLAHALTHSRTSACVRIRSSSSSSAGPLRLPQPLSE